MATFSTPRDIIDAFEQAVNDKDPDALGAIFTEDGEFVNVLGMRMNRREGIVAGHTWAFAGPMLGSAVRIDRVDELSVTDDVTVLHAHSTRYPLPDAPQALPEGRTLLVFVARRGADGWEAVAAVNVNELAPPGGPPAAKGEPG
jgi:uncharacterized protein (TIGR02246 family)